MPAATAAAAAPNSICLRQRATQLALEADELRLYALARKSHRQPAAVANNKFAFVSRLAAAGRTDGQTDGRTLARSLAASDSLATFAFCTTARRRRPFSPHVGQTSRREWAGLCFGGANVRHQTAASQPMWLGGGAAKAASRRGRAKKSNRITFCKVGANR